MKIGAAWEVGDWIESVKYVQRWDYKNPDRILDCLKFKENFKSVQKKKEATNKTPDPKPETSVTTREIVLEKRELPSTVKLVLEDLINNIDILQHGQN